MIAEGTGEIREGQIYQQGDSFVFVKSVTEGRVLFSPVSHKGVVGKVEASKSLRWFLAARKDAMLDKVAEA